ncbi:polysaccharide deacetylase family protein [Desulfovibrio aerotolerans]|uniref:Polysaccharide deacetylase family protein n=1 Tax=Solidesulfovibrio aerotolerans TaxID=295255 RepID=A0A7C9IJB9_9BACT|nr:polysaccharide deacetylase family protein [Solidesulfovibrio aerotolerans]MYL81544.1 polysaccharide deacetylase family protein [Solidesulfovibrio aerotolerans]
MRARGLFCAVTTAVCLLILGVALPARAATVLVYHSFGVRTSMSISLAAFEAQLDFLEKNGNTVIGIDELVRTVAAGQNPPDGAVVIAIDDGWATVMQAFEILKRRNLPFSLSLPMAYTANPYCKATLSQADIDIIKTYPKVVFADHSFSHSPKLAKSEDFARDDIRKSRERFRQVFGFDTKYFVYPYGAVSEAYTRLLREAGYEYLFVTGESPVSAATKIQAIPRIAAHRMSLPVLASVLRNQRAMMAKAAPAAVPAAPATDTTLVSATKAAEQIPHNVE